MAFEQTVKNLDNCLRTDKGCTSELDYVEQTSWILFLKYLDDLEYISFNIEPIQRTERVKKADGFRASLNATSQDFINYIIQLYVKEGIDELGPDKLPAIISMKYGSIPDGMKALGGVDVARSLFLDFQKNLYLGDARIAS